ncbi:MAG TPA: PAS domain S-box protein [Thermoanaerobaculia bacterium]
MPRQLDSGQDVHELLDSAPVIIWIADPVTFRITYVNKAAEEILGYPVEQWTEEPRFWIDHIHPDDLHVVDQCRRAVEERRDHQFVYRMIARDGRTVWLRDRVKVRKKGERIQLSGAMVDITYERETHDALTRSEANYRRLVDASPDAIGVHDGTHYVYVNPQMVRLFGAKSQEDLLTRDLWSLVDPLYAEKVRERQKRVAAGEVVPPLRQRVARLDGKYAMAEVTALPVVFNGADAVQVVARDITDRVTTEERLALLATGTSEAIWEVDFTSGAFWSNNAYREMIGDFATVDEAFAAGVAGLHPEDRERTVARVKGRLSGGVDSWSDEYRIRRRNGQYAWVLDRGRILHDEQGKPLRMIGALLDLTPLREAEQRHRQIVEDVHDVIYTTDTEGRITSLNRAFETATGFRAADWIGRPITELLAPETRDRASTNLNATLQQEIGGVRVYQLRNASGGLVDIEVSAKAHVVEGKVVGTIGVVRDVTERNRLQRNLEDARRISSLGQLAASVAHEFNNVLMAIQPFAEILLRTVPQSDATLLASRHITEAIARGKRVTSEILLYANPKEPHVEPLDVAAWLGSMIISLRAMLPENIRIEAEPADVSILCDRYHLEQVITNLATNARDAMPDGGTITLEVALDGEEWRKRVALDPSVRYARITVRDAGTGMDPSTLWQLWDPLFTTKRNGTGLGLPIAKRLVERQNGAIAVDTKVGEGSAFHLLLPVAAETARRDTHRATSPSPMPLQRVLLAEDEESVAAGLKALFELEGVECRHVGTGEQVMAAIAGFHPQVVVLDMKLPGMSGLEVLARIRASIPEQQVILSSGHFTELDLDRYTRALLKPYPFEELLHLCREAVAGGRG